MPPPINDEAAIGSHNVWHLKMEYAPDAFDFKRRLEVLDFMGAKRQILFPGAAPVIARDVPRQVPTRRA